MSHHKKFDEPIENPIIVLVAKHTLEYFRSWKGRVIVYLFYIVIAITVMRKEFVPGSMAIYVNPSIPPFRSQVIAHAFRKLYLWDANGNLGFPYTYPSEIYFDYIIGFFGVLGLSGEVLGKIVVLFCILLSGVFMYLLANELKIESRGAFIAGLFYMISPVVFTKILETHLFYLTGYCLSPLVFLLFVRSIEGNTVNVKSLVLSGLFFMFAMSQLQFLLMLFGLVAAYTLLMIKRKLVVKLVSLAVLALIPLLMHMPWILAIIYNLGSISSAATQVTIDSFIDTSLSPVNAFRISGFYFPFFEESAIRIVPFWDVFSMLLPILAFIPLLVERKNKNVLFFSCTALLTILFLSGFKSPLIWLFTWFAKNIMLAGLFREVFHLAFLLAFSYSILLGISVSALEKLFSRKLRRNNKIIPQTLSLMLIASVLLPFSGPFFTGDFGGNLYPYDFKDYEQVYEDMAARGEDFRVLMLPMDHIVKYDLSWKNWGSDLFLQHFAKGTLDLYLDEGTDSHRFTTYIFRKIHEERLANSPASASGLAGDTSSLAKILGLANVKYVVLRKNVIGIYEMEDFETVKNKLLDSADFKLLESYNNGTILVFENNQYIPHIYASDRLNLFAGDLSMVTEDNAAPFYVICDPEDLKDIPFTGLYLHREYYVDYISAFIPDKYVINLRQHVPFQSNSYRDWAMYSRTWWDDPRFTKSFEDLAITRKSGANLPIPFFAENATNYIVLIKFSLGALWDYLPESKCTISLDGKQIKTFSIADAPLREVVWANLKLGEISKGEHELAIKNTDGQTALLKVIVVPEHIFQKSLQEAESYLMKATKDAKIQIMPQYKQLPLDGFEKGSAGYPGEITVRNGIAEFSFQVNKSRNKDTGFGFINAIENENWTKFSKLQFQIYPETSGDYEIVVAIYSSNYYDMLGDVVRFWLSPRTVVPNKWNTVSIDLSKMPRDDIDMFYFQVGDDMHYYDGQNVTFKFSNFTLVDDSPIKFNLSNPDDAADKIKITVEKLEPTRYVVHCNATKPFFLIFSERYDPSWEAVSNGERQFRHFKANFFANAWYIDETGNLTITLEYSKQKLFDLGLGMSLLTLALLLGLLLTPLNLMKKIKNKLVLYGLTH